MSKPAKMSNGKVVAWKNIEYPTVYANIMGFSMTPFDISLIMGEVGESTETAVEGIPKVKVMLSPEQASNLVLLLGLAVETYAKNNGALRRAGAVDMEEMKKQVNDQSTSKA